MEIILKLLVFFFGASLGSFLMVVADRYNTGRRFWNGRSFCFSCGYELKKKDLFPIFSFVFLKGKCRECGSRIPYLSLIVEILMGLLSLLAAYKLGFFSLELEAWSLEVVSLYFVLTAVFAVILLISIYDLRHFIIPDAFLIALFILSFFYLSVSLSSKLLAFSLFSAFVLSLPFLLLFLFSKGRWIGFGDIKYMAVIGFFLGLAQGLSAVILAFWIGALVSVALLAIKKFVPGLLKISSGITIKSEIPFGPFLSLGTILSFYSNVDIFQIQKFVSLF